MDNKHPNGRDPQQDQTNSHLNPYADAVEGTRPRELVEFELHTDPYANMLPRVSSMTQPQSLSSDSDDDLIPARSRRSPIVLLVSLLLIAVLVLPAMAEVFARLFH